MELLSISFLGYEDYDLSCKYYFHSAIEERIAIKVNLHSEMTISSLVINSFTYILYHFHWVFCAFKKINI